MVFHVAAHSALLIHFSYFGNEEKEKISGTLAGAGGVEGVEGSPEVVGWERGSTQSRERAEGVEECTAKIDDDGCFSFRPVGLEAYTHVGSNGGTFILRTVNIWRDKHFNSPWC